MHLVWTQHSNGEYLDGGRTYRLHLPADTTVKIFWSVAAFDSSSRSTIRNGKACPILSAYTSKPNADGSVDLWFGPNPPNGNERNWIRTEAGRGWFPCLRFYSPLEPLFEHAWRPGDIVEVGPPGDPPYDGQPRQQ